jgi:hypothetical protein
MSWELLNAVETLKDYSRTRIRWVLQVKLIGFASRLAISKYQLEATGGEALPVSTSETTWKSWVSHQKEPVCT